MFRKGPIRRGNDGYTINVDAAHRRVLADLLAQLRDSVLDSTDDDRFRRLFPVAYHADPDHDSEYQRLMHGELLATRLDTLSTTLAILGNNPDDESIIVTASELDSLTRSLNDLRLVLGTLLDVQEDDYDEPTSAEDPSFAHFQLYGYLGWLLEWAVQAQQEALDDR
jgi:hypothetical protein